MNNVFLKSFLTLFCFLFACHVFSQGQIQIDESGTNEEVTAEKLKSDRDEYLVKYSIHYLHDRVISNSEINYHQLTLDEGGCLTKIGYPSLPILTQLVAIPKGASISVSIQEMKWKDVSIGKIYPSQKPLLEDERLSHFDVNENAYKQAFFPRILQISKEMEWRGIRNVRLMICPFKYFPTQNRLSVLCEFILNVKFQYKFDHTYDKTDIVTNNVFDNSNYDDCYRSSLFLRNQSLSLPQEKMLIIVGKHNDPQKDISWLANCKKMKDFCKWKAFKGIGTYVVKMNIQPFSSSEIKDTIEKYYNLNNIKYVLLVGDTEVIPLVEVISPYTGKGSRKIYSDYYYGCLGGENDYEADVAVGRFSVRDIYEFEKMVNKTIKYEKEYVASNRVLLVSHLQDAEPEDTTVMSFQKCCNMIKNSYYKEPVSFVTAYGAHVDSYGDNATNADVIKQINNGAHIINYRGHGGNFFWGGKDDEEQLDTAWNFAGERFWNTQIDNMADNTCAIFFSIACYTGNINEDECMLETFTRSPHGAVAFLGSTMNSYRSPNNDFNRYLFDELLNNGVYRIGDLNIAAHMKNIRNSSDVTLAMDGALCYLLGGDPTLEIWTGTPQVNKNLNLRMENNQMHFNIEKKCSGLGSLIQEDGIHLQNIYYESNNGSFDKPNMNFYFVLNSHNFFPHIAYCNLTSNEITSTTFNYDGFSFVTPLTIKEGYDALEEDAMVKVKAGNKLYIQQGNGGVTIENCFECEKGAVLEIK